MIKRTTLGVIAATLAMAIVPLAPAGAREECDRLRPSQVRAPYEMDRLEAGRVVRIPVGSEANAFRLSYRTEQVLLYPLPVGEDSKLLSLQAPVNGKVHVLVEWHDVDSFPLDQTDIDLHANDAKGRRFASSMVYNPFPEPLRTAAGAYGTPIGDGSGGPGWEYLEFPTSACAGYSIEMLTGSNEDARERISVKVWMTAAS